MFSIRQILCVINTKASQAMLDKNAGKNVGKIDPVNQFHQHFTCTFFVQKSFEQLFSA